MLTQEEYPTYEEFERRWTRSEELCDVLKRLSNEAILRSGMSGQRNKLLERWGELEVPNLGDDSPNKAVLEAVNKWIKDAETLIRYIVQMGNEEAGSTADSRTYSEPDADENELPEVIEKISEADAVKEDWRWPWEEKALVTVEKKKRNIDVAKIAKYGLIGAGVLYAINLWIEE